MLAKFKTYQMSIELFESCQKLKLPAFLKQQMLRAASSITLNTAEGSGRKTIKDRQHFFTMALGSIREVKAILDLSKQSNPELDDLVDHIGACLFKLSR